MNKAILIKENLGYNFLQLEGTYFPCDDLYIQLLHDLFTEGYRGEELRQIIDDDQVEGVSFNTVYLNKEDETISLGSHFDKQDRTFEISKTHLFELIDKWAELAYHVKPPKIIITRDGEKFTIDAGQ